MRAGWIVAVRERIGKIGKCGGKAQKGGLWGVQELVGISSANIVCLWHNPIYEDLQFYTDTHVPKAVAIQLRARGIEVVRCEEAGLAEVDDIEHLEYATSQSCTLVSHDLDFVQLHSQWLHDGQRHCGIVVFNRKFQGNVGKLVTELTE